MWSAPEYASEMLGLVESLEEEMTVMSWVVSAALLVGSCPAQSATNPNVDPAKAQITVLYDAFGQTSGIQKDWGYAAFVEYGGKRILFDTGNNPDILAQNAKAKGIDFSKLDFVVMSQRHGDHMGGLTYLLTVNPKVAIYALKEVRRPRCGLARKLLSQRPVPSARAALLQRCGARSHALWLGLAQRQFPTC